MEGLEGVEGMDEEETLLGQALGVVGDDED